MEVKFELLVVVGPHRKIGELDAVEEGVSFTKVELRGVDLAKHRSAPSVVEELHEVLIAQFGAVGKRREAVAQAVERLGATRDLASVPDVGRDSVGHDPCKPGQTRFEVRKQPVGARLPGLGDKAQEACLEQPVVDGNAAAGHHVLYPLVLVIAADINAPDAVNLHDVVDLELGDLALAHPAKERKAKQPGLPWPVEERFLPWIEDAGEFRGVEPVALPAEVAVTRMGGDAPEEMESHLVPCFAPDKERPESIDEALLGGEYEERAFQAAGLGDDGRDP